MSKKTTNRKNYAQANSPFKKRLWGYGGNRNPPPSFATFLQRKVDNRLLELRVIQRGIAAALRKQLLVRSLLDDVAVLEDEDQIGVLDRGEAVRDDERRASLGYGDRFV